MFVVIVSLDFLCAIVNGFLDVPVSVVFGFTGLSVCCDWFIGLSVSIVIGSLDCLCLL